jgi:WXG100 protein secretion system (Wss), protein YukD
VLPADLAAATGGRAVKGRHVRLLTIAGVGATADVVVAADVPAGELPPALAKLVGGWQLPPDDPGWALLTADGTVLGPAATLQDQGVQDGQVLYLRASRHPTALDLDPGAPYA